MSSLKILFRITKFNLLFLIFSLVFYVPLGYAQDDQEVTDTLDAQPLISMDFQDASFKDILKALSIQSGINFIASQEVEDRKVTLYLDQVPVKEAIDNLFKANNLGYEYYEEAKIILVKKGDPEIKTTTRVFPLRYHSVPSSKMKQEIESNLECSGGEGGDIVASLKEILSTDGKITEDTRTNSLIITELPSRFPVIEEILAKLDLPTPQALLEVEILDVDKGFTDKLGVNWPETLAKLDVTGAKVTSFPFWDNTYDHSGAWFLVEETAGGWENVTWPANKFGPTILTVIGAELTLDLLKSQQDTKTLARPRILTLNNETAEIKITSEEVVGVTRVEDEEGGQGVSRYEAERYETGVSLRVTPQINLANGEITMFLVPRVSNATESNVPSAYGTFWDPETRSTKSIVRVKDGQTVVLGGLIRKETYEERYSVPILGDIPIIGAAFRHKEVHEDERELLVFITPHIIKDDSAQFARGSSMFFSAHEQDISLPDLRSSTIKETLDSLSGGRY